ncbi:MAG: hypothetical protein WC307_02885 [Candidatus Nanoarchaeia archaeon]
MKSNDLGLMVITGIENSKEESVRIASTGMQVWLHVTWSMDSKNIGFLLSKIFEFN